MPCNLLHCFLFIHACVAVACGLPGMLCAQGPTDPAPVRATVIRRQVVSAERSFVGTATPIRQAMIGSAVEGRVSGVFVEEGDVIRPEVETSEGLASFEEAGVPLIQLRTATIDIELEAARSELALRLALQQELQVSLPADLDLARATLAAAEARLQFATAEWERGQSLANNSRGLSLSELDQLRSTRDAAVQDSAAARATLNKLEVSQQARLAQVAAQVHNQREAIRLLEDRRNKYTVRAPFEGVVAQRVAEVGQWITTGADVARVVQMNPMDVVIMVPQGMLDEFQYSLRAARTAGSMATETTAVPAIPEPAAEQRLSATLRIDGQEEGLTGHVEALVPSADLLSRSFPVKIRVQNPLTDLGYRLNPGMLVKVQITVGQVSPRLMVHKDALVLNSSGKSLMVIDRSVSPPVARSVSVALGAPDGNLVEVIGDVRDQDWVVIEGNERLRTGNPVKVINEDMLAPRITTPATLPAAPIEVAGNSE